MPETETPVRLTAEIGHSGLQISGGIVHEEFDPDLRGLRGIKVYEEMRRNDPTVAVGLRLIKWVCGQVQWRVEPGGETPADVKAAEFLKSCMHDMSITWTKLIRDALTCCDFGFAWMEVIYKQRRGPEADPPSRHDDGLIGWRKVHLIGHSSWDSWDVDEKGGPRAFLQAGNYLNTVYVPPARIPIEKSILFRLDDEKNNPDGVSLLRSAYRPWWIKKNTEEVEAIGIERDLTGVLIIHLPVGATATDQAKAQDLLEQFKADDMAGFIAPQFGAGEHERWRFEIIGSPGNKTIDTDKTIQRYQTEIARNFLAQFLMLGSGKTGSFALSKDQTDIFEVAIGAILQNLEETMNRFLVPPLFRFNDLGKLTKLPELRAGRINRKDLGKFATGMKALGDGGFITANKTLEQFIRGEFELPELTEEEMQEPETEPTAPPGQQPGEQSGQLPEEDTGTAEDAVKREPKQQSEPEPDEDPEVEVPDPDDDDLWERLERESNRRLGGKRSASELLLFARRPYDYDGQMTKRSETFRSEMQGLAQQLREGKMSHAAWAQRSQEKIIVNTIDGYRLGVARARGVAPSKIKLTPEQRRAANVGMKEQLEYFARFSKEVKGQALEEMTSKVEARAKLYGGGVRSAMNGAYVGEQPDQKLEWVRHKEDSCPTCLEQAGKVKTGKQWAEGGILPSQKVQCNGNCGCELHPVKE